MLFDERALAVEGLALSEEFRRIVGALEQDGVFVAVAVEREPSRRGWGEHVVTRGRFYRRDPRTGVLSHVGGFTARADHPSRFAVGLPEAALNNAFALAELVQRGLYRRGFPGANGDPQRRN
jgi:hypothetical protein